MWYLYDLLILALIALLVWLSLRRGAVRGALAIVRLLVASLAGWAACALWRWCGGEERIGVALWAIAAGCLAGFATLIGLGLAERRWSERIARWSQAHRTWTRAIGSAVAITWIATYGFCWLILANAAAASSFPAAQAMGGHSLVTRWLLSRRLDASAEDPAGAAVRAPTAGGIDSLLALSGTNRTLTMLADMRAIAALSPEQRERLIARSPPLQALIADQALIAVIDDVHRLQLVDDACHGSLRAINQLANDPAIAALGDDAALRAALAALDPETLAAAIRACREAPGEQVAWSVASAASSLQAAAVLTTIGAWHHASGERLSWPRGARCGLARCRLAIAGAGATLTIASDDVVACWIDGREAAPTHLPPPPGPRAAAECQLSLPSAGDHAIILMVTPPLWSLLARTDSTATLGCRVVVRDAGARHPMAPPPAAITAPARP